MSKARRNREIRAFAQMLYPTRVRSVARAMRRHGRMPLEKREGQA